MDRGSPAAHRAADARAAARACSSSTAENQARSRWPEVRVLLLARWNARMRCATSTGVQAPCAYMRLVLQG